MKNEFYNFIKVFAEKLIDASYEKENNVVMIKHYNTFEITEDDIEKLAKEYGKDKYVVFYRRFHGEEMPEACDPFLNIIQQLYWKYYSQTGIEDFLTSFGVYSLHKSIFQTYIENSLCVRREDLILSEVEQEKELLLDTVVQMMLKISQEHPIMLCINELENASKATIQILNRLWEDADKGSILVLGAYNDLRNVLPHIREEWEQYIKRLENKNSIIDASLFDVPLSGESNGIFRFHSSDIDNYIIKLNNMLQMLEFEQASYYMAVIYRKLELEKLSIDDEKRFAFIEIYAQVSIYSEDIANALLLCNSLNEICKRHSTFRMHYSYNYLLGLTQVYNVKLSMAKKCADTCYRLAQAAGKDFLMFKAKMLKHMASMSGWHNIMFCADDIVVGQDILEEAEKYEYFNHLAHTYVYAFDNAVNWLAPMDVIEKEVARFQRGMDIAESIGNKHLMSVGYRKNIMLSSINGAFEFTTHYYGKLYDLVGDSDPIKAADIYKGLGYNLCATEKYEEANIYYNKALDIYYKFRMMDFVGETLYNMSMNCILANEFKTAYDYLQMCIKIVDTLHLNDLRVCNISKIFGLLALCSYRLGLYYNCEMYRNNTMLFLSHKLNSSETDVENIDPSYTACDDDLFLYYYVSALLEIQKENFSKALELLNSAQIYVLRSKGNQFFSYVQYYMTRVEVHDRLGEEKKAAKELDGAYIYAKSNNANEKMRFIEAVKAKKVFKPKLYQVGLHHVSLEQISEVTKQAGINKDFHDIKRQMEFLSVWQKMVDINGKEEDELVTEALNSFILNFGIDAMVYIRYAMEKQPKVRFQNIKNDLTEEKLELLTKYFDKHRTGFVISKIKKGYQEYKKIISIFGVNDVCSMIAIPFYVNEKLDNLFICYIKMRENWSSPTNKYLLDENDFKVYSLVLSQLVNSISMLEKQQEINEINIRLENVAITDYLTSLLNRDGLFRNIHKRVAKAQRDQTRLDLTVLYIDLDNFKYYNDTFGHDVGDLVLKEISKIFMEQSANEGFAARFGGDEFLIILEHADADKAMKKAKSVLNQILERQAFVEEIKNFLGKEDIVIPTKKILSCSIGVATIPEVKDDNDIAMAIKRADAALYGIKHSKKCDCKLAVE